MNKLQILFDKIYQAKKIVITSHQSPDGDSVGSSVALYHFCKEMLGEKEVEIHVIFPDEVSEFYLKLLHHIPFHIGEKDENTCKTMILSADLLFCLDYNHANRVGEKLLPAMEQTKAYKIMIDHHLQPSNYADLLFSETSACSTCQLIFEIIDQGNRLKNLNSKAAKALYLGIVTDSGSFRFNSVTPKTHQIASELLKMNIDHDKIHEEIIDLNTIEKLKLMGYVLKDKLVLLPEQKTAYISLSKKEKENFDIKKGDTEGLVNMALSINGIKIAAFFSEENEFTKISFRSKGKSHPVNEMAKKYFNGGGHANAAGGKYFGSLQDTLSLFMKVLPNFIS